MKRAKSVVLANMLTRTKRNARCAAPESGAMKKASLPNPRARSARQARTRLRLEWYDVQAAMRALQEKPTPTREEIPT